MNEPQARAEPAHSQPPAWTVPDWCKSSGISRTTEFRLPAEEKPHSVNVRGRRFIIESPADWFQRLARQQRSAA